MNLTLNETLARVDALLELKDGWLDGEGLAIKPRYGRRLKRVLLSNKWTKYGIAYPYIYPTISGGFQLDWGCNGPGDYWDYYGLKFVRNLARKKWIEVAPWFLVS